MLVLGWLSFIAAGQSAELDLDLGWDRGRFAVADPAAARSAASRIGIDLADKQGHIPQPTSGYALTSDVVIVADDGEWRAGLDPQPVRVGGLDRVWVIAAPSIQEASLLASELAQLDSIEAAFLNAAPPWSERSSQAVMADDDPMFDRQWTLRNAAYPGADARIAEAWAKDVSGEGVVIGLLEKPIDTAHPDLASRFDAELSMPIGDAPPDQHSTAVAGIAVAARNGVGMVGAAPGARLATMPAGTTLDTIAALLHERDRIPIKLGTWGRSDRHRLSHLGPATREALAEASKTTAIVWAAGNGGPSDRLDHDAFASSAFVLPITAVGDLDLRATYGEPGSAQLISAHSSGNARSVVATLPGGEWTTRFGGTSAAAPLAAGAIALALEANPALTPRDIEYLLVRSARVLDERSGVWLENAAGTKHSDLHGFGAVNAAAMVEMARDWQPIGELIEWSSGVRDMASLLPEPVLRELMPESHLRASRDRDSGFALRWVEQQIAGPEGLIVEHIEVLLSVRSTHIGDLQIELISPGGTVSLLASPRPDPQDDLRSRAFLSRKHWGEGSAGAWTVRIADAQPGDVALWQTVELRITGTQKAEP